MKTKVSSSNQEKATTGEKASLAEETPVAVKSTARPSKKSADVAVADAKKPKKTQPAKDAQCTFSLSGTEYESLQNLRHQLGVHLGHKIKKGQLLRLAVRILLHQTPSKLKAELAKLAAE